MSGDEKKNIVILATGGTIAGAGEPGKSIGYKSGAIDAQTLIDAVPELKNVANVFVEQVCNINSDDITSEIWILLARKIQELAFVGLGELHKRVDGFVIMHGTDMMEETAFFLSLTLGSAEVAERQTAVKPVILTGSMRPATAAEPDGPANLLFAVKCAVERSLQRPERAEGAAGSVVLSPFDKLKVNSVEGSPAACRPGHSAGVAFGMSSRPGFIPGRDHLSLSASNIPVYVAFAGKLMDARTVQKVHANDLDAFDEIAFGASHALGSCHARHVIPASDPEPSLFSRPAFDISSLRSLPKVAVLYFNADADAELIRFAAERSAGLVIAGAGAGEFSRAWAAAIADVVEEAKIPVVVSTRINRGCIVPEQLLVSGTIAAGGLPPAKAAVLLRLALTVTRNQIEIQKIFNECLPINMG